MNMFTSESSVPDNLIAGPVPPAVPVPITVASGSGVLARGTVLGKITTTSYYTIVNSAGSDDGRRTANKILTEDIDATSVDVVTSGYDMGAFNENALTFGGTDTADTHRATLEAKNIYLHAGVQTGG